MSIASSLSYSKSLQNPIDRTWMMMIILLEVPVDTHTLPVLLFTKDRYSPPGVLSALAFEAPASQGGGSLQALARKASKAMQVVCIRRCGQSWSCLRHHSLQKGIERLKDATATVYVPACICAFFSILESEKYVSSFHSPPCKTKIPRYPPKTLHFPHPNHPPFFFFTPSTSSCCCCCCSTSLGKTFVLLKYSLTLPSRTSSSFTCVAVLSPCSSIANLRARAASRLCFNRSISALISSLSKGISWVWPRLGQKSGTAKRESRLMPK